MEFINFFFSFAFQQSEVILYVNRLNTEESVIPYEYHHFDFCPINEENSPVENLGQVVFGERIRPGPYKIEFLKDKTCEKVIFNYLLFTPFSLNSTFLNVYFYIRKYVSHLENISGMYSAVSCWRF